MNELDFISTLFFERFKEAQEKAKKRKPNEIYVTDITECKKKSEFRRTLWFMDITNTSMLIGEIIHRGVEDLIAEHFKDKNPQIEYEAVKTIGNYEIHGRIDILLDDAVIEIKYMRGIGGTLPLQHHVEQVKLYLWLTNRDKGFLYYFTPDGFAIYEVKGKPTDQEVLFKIENEQSPKYEWECRYCSFRQICPVYPTIENRKGGKSKWGEIARMKSV